MEKLNQLLEEIRELNALDKKSITERVLKLNEEYGEFCAEIGKVIGITPKEYDEDHLIEEAADFVQNQFSVILDVFALKNIPLDKLLDKMSEKNQKWRNNIPLYVCNQPLK